MKHLLPILFMSILLSGEMEVAGDLKVTGTIQNQTIDSLLQVIAGLQAQLAAMQAQIDAMQVDNKLETRVFTVENYPISINLFDIIFLLWFVEVPTFNTRNADQSYDHENFDHLFFEIS